MKMDSLPRISLEQWSRTLLRYISRTCASCAEVSGRGFGEGRGEDLEVAAGYINYHRCRGALAA